MTPEEQARARAFVRSLHWQQARTTPGDEHQYSLPGWAPDQDERRWFVELIGVHGRRETFQARGKALEAASGTRWKYLALDGLRYWLSRVWTAEGGPPMLNRAKIEPQAQMTLEIEP